MTETLVQYHADGYAAARPAINVKCYSTGDTLWPRGWEDRPGWDAEQVRHDSALIGAAYDRVQSDFWQAAQEIATQRGQGEITQEGRSGGWLVFTDGRDPEDAYPAGDGDDDLANMANEQVRWLAAYRAMVEWSEAYIADAPRKVRSLAQDLAMDEAGERTVALRSWLAWGRSYAL